MSNRQVSLTVHYLHNRAYWVVVVDRGRQRRHVVARGLLSDLAEPSQAPLSLVLQEALLAAKRSLSD